MNNFVTKPVDEIMRPIVEFIAYGEDIDLESQLIEKSLQDNILKYTPKDSKERFGNLEMLKNWKSKGREVHWLIGPDKDLAGIIWYGKSEFPLDLDLKETPEETFAIRIYDGYTGKGLSRPFMTQSLRLLVEQRRAKGQDLHPIWLQTDIDNLAALSSYTKFGYEEVYRDDKRVTMVLSTSAIYEIAVS